jgi:FkbM family methyltransferase
MTAPEFGVATMMKTLLEEILRDSHHYTPGLRRRRPALRGDGITQWRRALRDGRELGLDALERVAARAGFTRRHFDTGVAGQRLARLAELAPGLEETYAHLADEPSRRAMLDVLKLRVLGPHHARLAITPQEFHDKQAEVNRAMRTAESTIEVSDPWFSPLSLYRISLAPGPTVSMHGHSVDVVSVFLLGQYLYARGAERVGVEPGDVVLDIGGCWGDTALRFAQLAGPAGHVYTFEFDPESLAVLRANLELNPALGSRIDIVEQAAWNRSDEMLEFLAAGRCTVLLEPATAQSSAGVSTVTLDDFADRTGLERLDFVKMDVEGAELQVLEGAGETLRRLRPKLAIAAYHHDDDLVTIPRAIESLGLGYRLFLDTYSPVEEETVLFAAVERS